MTDLNIHFEYKDIESLINRCSYAVIIGTGNRFAQMDHLLEGSPLSSKVRYIVDNDCEKNGKQIGFDGRIYTVEQVESLRFGIDDEVIIIITPKMYDEILAQCKIFFVDCNIHIFILSNILETYYDGWISSRQIPKDIKLCDKPQIPAIIHCCWFGRKQIPEEDKRWMDTWIKYCPEYEIKVWDEDNYDISKNQYMIDAYNNKNYAFVSDAVRHNVLYEYGGIYLDTDVELIAGIDDLRYQRGFISYESCRYVNSGGGIGACVHNRIIKDLVDVYSKMTYWDKNGNEQFVTCPQIETRVLQKYGLVLNGEYQVLGNCFTVFPEKLMFGKDYKTGKEILTPYTRAIHHYNASWL